MRNHPTLNVQVSCRSFKRTSGSKGCNGQALQMSWSFDYIYRRYDFSLSTFEVAQLASQLCIARWRIDFVQQPERRSVVENCSQVPRIYEGWMMNDIGFEFSQRVSTMDIYSYIYIYGISVRLRRDSRSSYLCTSTFCCFHSDDAKVVKSFEPRIQITQLAGQEFTVCTDASVRRRWAKPADLLMSTINLTLQSDTENAGFDRYFFMWLHFAEFFVVETRRTLWWQRKCESVYSCNLMFTHFETPQYINYIFVI